MPLSSIQRKKARLVGPGSTVGEFRLKKPLGKGGMGIVYEAVQAETRRRVAVKILAPHLCNDSSFTKRFLVEARATAAVDHPNVVKVLCAGRERETGILFIAMELVEGRSLQKSIGKIRFTFAEMIKIVRTVAGALAHAATRQIVHRDIKPSNVMLGADGRITLLDFGLAKCLNETHLKLTRIGKTVGTPEYMSPEQACAGEVDTRSDLYSLGVIFYEMLAGARPFEGDTQTEEFYLHCNRDPRSIRATRGNVPLILEEVLRKMLARKPEERYQGGQELIEDLDHAEFQLKEQGVLHASPRGPIVMPLKMKDGKTYQKLGEAQTRAAPKPPARSSYALIIWLVAGLALTGGAFALALGGFF